MFSKPGSSRSEPQDESDLFPVITYRHLLSQGQGVKNPLRVIALCDMDAFYAACEQVRLGLDPSIPLVVRQWNLLIAVNYPARKYGINRMCKIADAKRLCPHVRVVHVATYKEGENEPVYVDEPDSMTHKVSLDHYRRESMKIINIFKEGLPGAEIEKASIDEAFIDLTQPVREEILRRYPNLAEVPEGGSLDTPLPAPPTVLWEDLGALVPIAPDAEQSETHSEPDSKEKISQDATVDVPTVPSWHDLALSIGASLMKPTRERIHGELGYTTSAGIARNKFLAKLVASYKKPNTQSILRNAAIPNYLRPMEFQKIRFLGGKLGTELANEYDVSTIGDLLPSQLTEKSEDLQNKFGEGSIWVYEVLRCQVKEKATLNKSMGASKNLGKPVTKREDGYHWIRLMASELAFRLLELRETYPGVWPKTIVLHIRQGWQTSRSKQAPFPFVRNLTADDISKAGDKLWDELVGINSTSINITNLGLAFAGVEASSAGQRHIDNFLQSPDKRAQSPQKRKRKESISVPGDQDLAKADTQWTCPECRKVVTVPESDDPFTVPGEALATLKTIHEDEHMAQDLAERFARQEARQESSRTNVRPPAKKRKEGGILKFFQPK
ncbi:DNA/RNA polymerase [Sistotremastrum niveocremeum HHB9708]|uniref:DNA polymerase eta n=1 Tax=Sistotremastrum niveocremeum HHB9708 TaxID=1314777 RepID=A0A164TMC2_9AGAM|nr:DNA/RNA polymerase [Sistotremastrum niveocremeum HHB9708]